MMRAAISVVALLLLGGCSSSPAHDDPEVPAPVVELSQKVFDILPIEEVWVTASDGKRMNHAVVRPDTDEPVPVFINFSPYWGDTAMEEGDAFSKYMIEEYVPRGYAVVLSAVRGTGHSEGCFQIGGDRELQDLYEVVDFFANEPWSNGNVAAGGKSYDSTSQNGMIAKFPHPALKGIFHVSGISDMYAYNYKGGVPYESGPIFNTYYYLQGTDEYGVSLVGAGSHEDEDPESLARLIDDVACTEMPLIQAHGVGSAASGMKTDYWIERDWTRYIGDSDWNGSIFFVHGLQDWNVKPDHILPWIENLPQQIRVKGWLHQWTWPGSGGHTYPMRTDWNETMLAWMDHELKGIDSGFWDEPRWDVQSDDGVWYAAHDWPGSAGVLGYSEFDFSFIDGDGMRWVSNLFNETTHLTGDILLRPTLTGANPDPVLTVAIYDQAPDGSVNWLTEGVLRLVYRDGLEDPSPWVGAGAQETVEVRTYPFDHVFLQGHKLVVEFQQEPRFTVVTPAQMAGISISGFKETRAFMFLDQPMASQPIEMECFAC